MTGLDIDSFNKYFCGGPYQSSILRYSQVNLSANKPSVVRLAHLLFLKDVSSAEKEKYRLPDSSVQMQYRTYSRTSKGIDIAMVSKNKDEDVCVSGRQLIARPDVVRAIFCALTELKQESSGQELIERVITHWAAKRVRVHD